VTPFTMNAVVKIVYPHRRRRGKSVLIKGLYNFAEAKAYARKVAARASVSSLMGAWRDNPTACAYNLRDWGQAPVCYAMRPPESKKHPGSYKRGMPSIRQVPPTFAGYSKRRRRRR
jgi:hypothetical protein